MENKEFVVAEEIAIQELTDVVEEHTDEVVEPEDIKETYPAALKAIKLGLLTFTDDKTPILKLKSPVMSEAGNVSLDEIKFRTRILTTDKERLSKGVDLKKEPLLYGYKVMSFIIGQPKAMLDKLSKFDYKVVEQMCSLFS